MSGPLCRADKAMATPLPLPDGNLTREFFGLRGVQRVQRRKWVWIGGNLVSREF